MKFGLWMAAVLALLLGMLYVMSHPPKQEEKSTTNIEAICDVEVAEILVADPLGEFRLLTVPRCGDVAAVYEQENNQYAEALVENRLCFMMACRSINECTCPNRARYWRNAWDYPLTFPKSAC